MPVLPVYPDTPSTGISPENCSEPDFYIPLEQDPLWVYTPKIRVVKDSEGTNLNVGEFEQFGIWSVNTQDLVSILTPPYNSSIIVATEFLELIEENGRLKQIEMISYPLDDPGITLSEIMEVFKPRLEYIETLLPTPGYSYVPEPVERQRERFEDLVYSKLVPVVVKSIKSNKLKYIFIVDGTFVPTSENNPLPKMSFTFMGSDGTPLA